jgi:hypothetical protein
MSACNETGSESQQLLSASLEVWLDGTDLVVSTRRVTGSELQNWHVQPKLLPRPSGNRLTWIK